MGKKWFVSSDDFDKNLCLGDVFVFDNPETKRLRVVLSMSYCGSFDFVAFLLGADGLIQEREDLVYFNSRLRWLPAKPFYAEDFNPLEGRPSTYEEERAKYRNLRGWRDETLPLSSDYAVIGPWDDMNDDDWDDDIACKETMHVLLDKVDTSRYKSVVFAVAVPMEEISRGFSFKDARKVAVSIYDVDTKELIAQYQLDPQFLDKDAICLGNFVYGDDGVWTFVPMADGYNGGLQKLVIDVFN